MGFTTLFLANCFVFHYFMTNGSVSLPKKKRKVTHFLMILPIRIMSLYEIFHYLIYLFKFVESIDLSEFT